MKLSIIIPLYNAEKTIERCIHSIFRQNISDLQVIIVDDYSTDNSYEMCKKLKNSYPNLELFKAEGKGVSAARNTGLRRITGNIVGFCDADDYFQPNAFKEVLANFQRAENLSLCIFGFFIREESKASRILGTKGCSANKMLTATQMIERVLCDDRIMGSVWNKFYKRKILQNIFFNENISYCEDTLFNVKIFSQNRNIKGKLLNQPLYNYVRNTTSVTHNYENLYDENNELKYNVAMHQIEKECKLTINEKKFVKRAIYRFSVSECHNAVNLERKKILFQELKQSILPFIGSFYKFTVKTNIKLILLGILVVLKNISYSFRNRE